MSSWIFCMTWNTGSPIARIRMVCPSSTLAAWLGTMALAGMKPMAAAVTARFSKMFFLFGGNMDRGIDTPEVAVGSGHFEVFCFIYLGGWYGSSREGPFRTLA